MKSENHDEDARAELEASLRRLDIHELEERLEVSPLLMAAGETPVDPNMPDLCCVCKIPNPFGPDGSLPIEQVDPGPNTDLLPTGPTNPGIPR